MIWCESYLNKYKFEDKFLHKLNNAINKYYNKKVEFNIVNIKHIVHNSDIFTEILTTKLKNDKVSTITRMNTMLSKVHIPKINRIKERSRIEKLVDYQQIDNKYKTYNINTIMNIEDKNSNLVYKDSLNFSFSPYGTKLSLEDVSKVENLVNDCISSDVIVKTKVVNLQEMLSEDNLTILPGELYPSNDIRIVEVESNILKSK